VAQAYALFLVVSEPKCFYITFSLTWPPKPELRNEIYLYALEPDEGKKRPRLLGLTQTNKLLRHEFRSLYLQVTVHNVSLYDHASYIQAFYPLADRKIMADYRGMLTVTIPRPDEQERWVDMFPLLQLCHFAPYLSILIDYDDPRLLEPYKHHFLERHDGHLHSLRSYFDAQQMNTPQQYIPEIIGVNMKIWLQKHEGSSSRRESVYSTTPDDEAWNEVRTEIGIVFAKEHRRDWMQPLPPGWVPDERLGAIGGEEEKRSVLRGLGLLDEAEHETGAMEGGWTSLWGNPPWSPSLWVEEEEEEEEEDNSKNLNLEISTKSF
jgi:hypothetical protein